MRCNPESQTTQETRTNNRAASGYTWGNVTQPTTPEEPVIVLQKEYGYTTTQN